MRLLQTLDALVAAAVEEPPRASPPAAPVPGCCYIVAAGASGAWAGKQHCLAAYSSGGWRYIQPTEGMTAYVRSTETWAAYRSGQWELGVVRAASLVIGGTQVVGSRAAAIAPPTGEGASMPKPGRRSPRSSRRCASTG